MRNVQSSDEFLQLVFNTAKNSTDEWCCHA